MYCAALISRILPHPLASASQCLEMFAAIKKILNHIDEEIYVPNLKPAEPRGPPEQTMIFQHTEVENQVPLGW